MFILQQLMEVISPLNDDMNKEMIRLNNEINVNDIKLLLIYLCNNSVSTIQSVVIDMFDKNWCFMQNSCVKNEQYFHINKCDLDALQYFMMPLFAKDKRDDNDVNGDEGVHCEEEKVYDLEGNNEFEKYLCGFNTAKNIEKVDKDVVDMFNNVHPALKCEEVFYREVVERASRLYRKEKRNGCFMS